MSTFQNFYSKFSLNNKKKKNVELKGKNAEQKEKMLTFQNFYSTFFPQ